MLMGGCSERRFNIKRSPFATLSVQNRQKKNATYVKNYMITTTPLQLRLQVRSSRNSKYAVQGKKMINNELGMKKA
jgi:hypothetical protein